MALNTNNFSAGGGADLGQARVGPHVALLTGVIDVGLQEGGSYKGVAKAPCQKLVMLFELTDDTVEIDGVVSNRRYSTTVNAKSGEKATLTKLVNALDPTGVAQGDLTKLIGHGCILSLKSEPGVEAGKTFIKLDTAMPLMPGMVAPAITLPRLIFDTSEPDLATWDMLVPWMQEKVKSAINYNGSQLQSLIAKYEADKATNTLQQAQAQPAQQATVQQATPPAQVINTPVLPTNGGLPTLNAVPTTAPVQQDVPPIAAAPAIPAAPPGFYYDPATNSFKVLGS